jgi:glycogen phosphorylase
MPEPTKKPEKMINIKDDVEGIVAYFSMEMALEPDMPTYSGGLGVLAGDTIRAAADSGLRMVGVTLLYKQGYFKQVLDAQGNQSERPVDWKPESFLERLDTKIPLHLDGRTVQVGAWRYRAKGVFGNEVEVIMLDTDLPENSATDRGITGQLYGGDARYRLLQEMVLGPGGLTMLRALGYSDIATCHMNEGHSSLLSLSLYKEERDADPKAGPDELMARVKERCVFTTHTPVPAGHDVFSRDLVASVLNNEDLSILSGRGCLLNNQLNMTYLGLHCSRYVNGVSMRNEQVTEDMYPDYPINSVTNGVHAATWTSQPFRDLFDKHIPEWRQDNRYLRYAVGIEHEQIMEAHSNAKAAMVQQVKARTGFELDPNVLTIVFARRATQYKRADMLLSDINNLKRIAKNVGPLQIVYSGKAHPKDEPGKALIRKIYQMADQLRGSVPVVYIPDYDMRIAGYLVSGADLWLNTPQKPHEASGTSGMKAALNGVPSLSILDGWWIEGHVEGVTGWSVGESWRGESDSAEETKSLFEKLEFLIVPMFYDRKDEYGMVMRYAIALNGAFFNSQRMLSQYVHNAYQIETPLHDVPLHQQPIPTKA